MRVAGRACLGAPVTGRVVEYERDVGFTSVRVERLPHDFQNLYYIARRD
jgi:hypothetical protein